MGLVRKLLRKTGLWRRKIPLLCRLVRFDSTLAFGGEEFRTLYAQAEPRTLVGKARCLWLWRLAKFTAGKDGEIAEVGVYKGGTARILARACPQKTVHLFDTFAGMPEVRPEIDSHKPGDFGDTSLEAVEAFLKDCANVRLHPGFFPETAAGLENRRFCFVNVDVDIYSSTKACLEFFYPRMVPGGAMAFDDYNWQGCAGVKQAIDEFLDGKPEQAIEMESLQCVIFKA